MNSVQIKVAETILSIAPKVEDKVVGVLVERELAKRSTALVQVMDKLVDLEKDLKKLDRPDQKSYDNSGKVLTETYSKGLVDNVAKAKQKVEKHTKAINKALDSNDFGDVYQLASGKDTSDGGKQGSGDATEDAAG